MMEKGVVLPVRSLCVAALIAVLASCAPIPAPPEPPPPAPQPQPEPPPPPPPPPPPVDWQDAPATVGDWSWQRASGADTARFGTASGPLFLLRCEGGRQLSLSLPGPGQSPLIVRTSYGDRSLAAQSSDNGLVARLPAADPLFDQMVFSRGHFAVEARGAARLVLPAWGEPARVIEECRG